MVEDTNRNLLTEAEAPEEDAEERQTRRAISRDRDRMALPAIYIDKFFTSYWKGHARLSLGERATYSQNGTFWRFTALLEKSDVEGLIERLQSVLKSMEEYEKPEKEG